MQQLNENRTNPLLAERQIAERNRDERAIARRRHTLGYLIPLICLAIPIVAFIYDLTQPSSNTLVKRRLDLSEKRLDALSNRFSQLELENDALRTSLETLAADFKSQREHTGKKIDNGPADCNEKIKDIELVLQHLKNNYKSLERTSEKANKKFSVSVEVLQTTTDERFQKQERKVAQIEKRNIDILQKLGKLPERNGASVDSSELEAGSATVKLKVKNPTKGRKTLCPENYLLNPHSETCVRMVKLNKSWWNANEFCKDNSEHVATFETTNSVNWIINQMKTTPEWHGHSSWIGGRYFNSDWIWIGKPTKLIGTEGWDVSEPRSKSQHSQCVAIAGGGGCRFYTVDCAYVRRFLCERLPQEL